MQQGTAGELQIEEAETPCSRNDYIFIDHVRLVQPYFFDFKCTVKRRWEGKPFIDTFAEEFPLLTREYYQRAFATGRLRIQLKPHHKATEIGIDTRLQDGMVIRHLVHRHEPPVLADPLQVLYIGKEWVAIVKPACMPVHTLNHGWVVVGGWPSAMSRRYNDGALHDMTLLRVGQYRKNTVLGVMQAEHPELGTLHPTYRLDRPVSGLLVLARSPAAAARMRVALMERACQKAYVARVQGKFPGTQQELSAIHPDIANHPHLRWTTHYEPAIDKTANFETNIPRVQGNTESKGSQPQLLDGVDKGNTVPTAETNASAGNGVKVDVPKGNVIEVDVPLTWCPRTNHATSAPVIDSTTNNESKPKDQLEARPAMTQFKLLQYCPEANQSIVQCWPKTGRSHQIRVHLQYLGFPIANDTEYGGLYGKPLNFRKVRQALEQQSQARQQTSEPQQGIAEATQSIEQHPLTTTSQISQQASHLALLGKSQQGTVSADGQCGSEALQPEQQHPEQQATKRMRHTIQHGDEVEKQDIVSSHDAGPQADLLMAKKHLPASVQNKQYITAFSQGICHNSTIQVLNDNKSVIQEPGTTQDASAAVNNPAQNLATCMVQGRGGPTDQQSQDSAVQPAVTHEKDAFIHEAIRGLNSDLLELYHDPRFRVPTDHLDEICPHCPCLVPQGYPIDLQPLWLHAVWYKCAEWEFHAPLPDWATTKQG